MAGEFFPEGTIFSLVLNARLIFGLRKDLRALPCADTRTEGFMRGMLIQARNVNRQNELDDEGSGRIGR